MIIKKFKKFIESISGWEIIGTHMGPGYPEQKIHNTLSQKDTNILIGMDDNFYTHDDYQTLYQAYLKDGNSPLTDGFNLDNLNKILIKKDNI
jgi:hypothetical protein